MPLPLAKNNFPGRVPLSPVDGLKYFYEDGVWLELPEPPVEHEELHTDNGGYDL
jgi:hypothetical protein